MSRSPAPTTPITLDRSTTPRHLHRVQLFRFLGIPFDMVDVDLLVRATVEAFLAENPFVQVPVIENDAVILVDSSAFLPYFGY